MNTDHDNESTRFVNADDEATCFEEEHKNYIQGNSRNSKSGNTTAGKPGMKAWARHGAGAGAGLLIGGLSTMLMGMKSADSAPDSRNGNDTGSGSNREELSHPEWVDDQVQVATGVSDDMSFGAAFAAARAEVGAGGCFEWHGNLYGTYTADEWNSMTAEQRAEYGDHFNWNSIDHSGSDVAAHSSHSAASEGHQAPADAHTAQAPAPETDDDIEVVSVDGPDGNGGYMAQTGTQAEPVQMSASQQDSQEIEIIGVVHDDASGRNIGQMTVDGQEVILIDVDGDMEFDYVASDLNGNGNVDEGEMANIQGQGLTVDGIGGFIDPGAGLQAAGDAPDYSSDPIYEG